MITSEVDRVMEKKLKTEHTLAVEELLMDMSKTNHAAANNDVKDASHSLLKNILTKMTLNVTLDDLFIRSLERGIQAPEFMDTLTQNDLNSRTSTNPLATFVKQQMNNTVDQLRLNAKEGTDLAETEAHPVTPPLLSDTSSSKDLQGLT